MQTVSHALADRAAPAVSTNLFQPLAKRATSDVSDCNNIKIGHGPSLELLRMRWLAGFMLDVLIWPSGGVEIWPGHILPMPIYGTREGLGSRPSGRHHEWPARM
jgi:hypothetical protein